MARITATQKLEVRRKLLEAAAQHFSEAGLDRASVDAISVAAGFAKGTLYNYFPSKQALFGAVIEEASRRAAERYREVEVEETTRAHLLALARADLEVMREEEDFMKVLVREAMSFRPESYALVTQHLGPYVLEVEAALARGVERGEIRGDRPTPQLALLFVGLLGLMYGQHWGSAGAWPALDEVPELVVTSFLDGAGAEGSRPAKGTKR
ncbi:MAG: TetR/AcrR family transcriptional regulator [Deltaproteobacteria bacterium]|nr:TetR/AcrR family transcriptional regulator [Deltaproteobacteria bacterium]